MSRYQFPEEHPNMHLDDRYEIIGYVDSNGIEHESFSAACQYYGCDTPEMDAWLDVQEFEEWAASHPSQPPMEDNKSYNVGFPCRDDPRDDLEMPF